MPQLNSPPFLQLFLTIVVCLIPFTISEAADALQPVKPILLKNTHGKFDFLTIDAERRRLLAAHTGNSSLDVIDVDKSEVIKIISTGKAQAAVIDAERNRYYVTTSEPQRLVSVDANTLQVTGSVNLDGPADLVAFEQKSRRAYVGHDDGSKLWIVDPDTNKLVGTVKLPTDSPEDLAFDKVGGRLFQSMKTGNIIAVIDVLSGKVVQSWPTAPVEAPHGMAMVADGDSLLTAGGNGKLALMSTKDGHIISSVNIAHRVDQIAFDRALHRVYCASGMGVISVVSIEKDALVSLGDVITAEGCHSVSVDPKSHCVWIAYARGNQSYVQAYTPSK